VILVSFGSFYGFLILSSSSFMFCGSQLRRFVALDSPPPCPELFHRVPAGLPSLSILPSPFFFRLEIPSRTVVYRFSRGPSNLSALVDLMSRPQLMYESSSRSIHFYLCCFFPFPPRVRLEISLRVPRRRLRCADLVCVHPSFILFWAKAAFFLRLIWKSGHSPYPQARRPVSSLFWPYHFRFLRSSSNGGA